MKIGVISDTHGSLPDAAGDALKKCDYLITVLNDDTVYALIERASGSSECNVISKI